MNEEILIVAGPTASGKSALGLTLARAFHGTIINADSMQLYRDLPILTAQPDEAARREVPHRLYGEVDAEIAFSVARWRERAVAEIAAARAAGSRPILVGGTGMYLRVLLEGMADIPLISQEIIDEAQSRRRTLGGAAFHAALRALDPAAAERLAPGDSQRVLRAYTVVRATGRTLAQWQAGEARDTGLVAAAIVLLPPRGPLYAACNQRFRDMMARGAEREVRVLLERGLAPTLPAMRALGVREIASWLRGEADREHAVAAAQQATRNYAKRQYTWFKHQMNERPGLRKIELDTQYLERNSHKIFAFIRP